jgi:hypothetical protein
MKNSRTANPYGITQTKADDVASPGAGVDGGGGGNVVLRGTVVALDTGTGLELLRDCVRHVEGVLSEDDIKAKWGLTESDWEGLATNKFLLDLVRRERERRVFNGATAREVAQHYFAKAPTVLGGILNDSTISPRHRIEAARELRQAATGQDIAQTQDKENFVVIINLGLEKPIRIEKEIEHRAPSLELDNGDKS